MTTSGLSALAQRTIEGLGLSPHPEGGWYRRTWQSSTVATGADASDDASPIDMGEHSTTARPLASLIYFLLPAGDASAWHVVDADEVWLWHGPGSVVLELGGSADRPDEEAAVRHVLGTCDDGMVCGHVVVSAGTWQRTVPTGMDALVSCVVSPGFTYAGFSLASDEA